LIIFVSKKKTLINVCGKKTTRKPHKKKRKSKIKKEK